MFEVRQIEETDIDRIACLEQQIFPDSWSYEAVRDTYRQDNSVLFGAFDGGRLIGYLIVYYVLDEGEIARIAVEEGSRRQGAAGHMLLKLEDFCEEKGIARLMLEVRESNEAAAAFYKDYGFEEDGVRKGYYANPLEDAVLMSRRLGR
ncbi:ribosomal-protein-alanine N-acetyltransferase RimI [Lachnospiraceae bacterium]|uniref:ribosomal protein S18-alanine N-acetyltransferase n=1 Tax=Extibacter sp. GGCC_0201 TaxID=2731209 RepID=UPI001AA0F34D|nr:ribosomal protein S18-alanine N-acetyltransferase [Extibacter sp. GGCC_0201]MBO1721764.1 ribosomal protein S18-alanine N-acetyltransferase [Extibacter sp. GGCC_0201]BDF32493.1 ribosomal-protein-alanine N-acetyltransferase RimI [Lachnospiraceae bacterium]BDF36503.1 ribosomal-protein-alanine N-acetyltransferase RimI [Lachnospiraceae bacterium]